jgi:hypothetical protein
MCEKFFFIEKELDHGFRVRRYISILFKQLLFLFLNDSKQKKHLKY